MGARVLFAEDDVLVCAAVRRRLAWDSSVARVDLVTAESCARLRACLAHGGYAALVVDIALADGHSLDVLDEARARLEAGRTLVITGGQAAAVLNRAADLGAPILFKGDPDFGVRVVAFIARCVATQPTPEDRARRECAAAGATRRETEIATAIARGVSRAALARTLGVAEPTIRTHVRHLLSRLGAKSTAELRRLWAD